MKPIKRRIQFAPSDADRAELLQAVSRIHPEWGTVLLLCLDVGIAAACARHMKWEAINTKGTKVSFQSINTDEFVTRTVPNNVVDHLKTLPRTSIYLCPELHELTNHQFIHQWKSLRAAANVDDSRSLPALTWRYRDLHTQQIEREKSLRHLLRLSRRWLTPPEIEALMAQVPIWEKYGARQKGRKPALIMDVDDAKPASVKSDTTYLQTHR